LLNIDFSPHQHQEKLRQIYLNVIKGR